MRWYSKMSVAELLWDPAITHQGINVTVKDGVVTLRGIVPSYAEKVAAERAAGQVAGVRAVAEEIEVRLPTAFELTDQALAARAANALDWAAPVPHGNVKPRVERGWITPRGDREVWVSARERRGGGAKPGGAGRREQQHPGRASTGFRGNREGRH